MVLTKTDIPLDEELLAVHGVMQSVLSIYAFLLV